MLTPPYHYSIVAAPPLSLRPSRQPSHDQHSQPQPPPPPAPPTPQILYRGSIPSRRNFTFLDRLGVKTLIHLSETPASATDALATWAQRRKVELRWIKATEMGEEKLGMGRTEVGDALRMLLDTSAYPLYIADVDGKSHTTLVVACLRKLQGWHIDSIIGEMCRFEPEHEEYSLVPFVTSFLASSDSSFTLPPGPYPDWLWPASPAPQGAPLTRISTRERVSSPATTQPPSSTSSTNNANTPQSAAASSTSLLPFPHPLQSRKHPTMKIVFPAPAQGPITPLSPSKDNLRQERAQNKPEPREQPDNENRAPNSLDAVAATLFSNGISGAVQAILGGDSEGSPKDGRNNSSSRLESSGATSPDISRQLTVSSMANLEGDSTDSEDDDPAASDEDDEDEYDDDDEEDEDEDEDTQPTSQYISALDLAGY